MKTHFLGRSIASLIFLAATGLAGCSDEGGSVAPYAMGPVSEYETYGGGSESYPEGAEPYAVWLEDQSEAPDAELYAWRGVGPCIAAEEATEIKDGSSRRNARLIRPSREEGDWLLLPPGTTAADAAQAIRDGGLGVSTQQFRWIGLAALETLAAGAVDDATLDLMRSVLSGDRQLYTVSRTDRPAGAVDRALAADVLWAASGFTDPTPWQTVFAEPGPVARGDSTDDYRARWLYAFDKVRIEPEHVAPGLIAAQTLAQAFERPDRREQNPRMPVELPQQIAAHAPNAMNYVNRRVCEDPQRLLPAYFQAHAQPAGSDGDARGFSGRVSLSERELPEGTLTAREQERRLAERRMEDALMGAGGYRRTAEVPVPPSVWVPILQSVVADLDDPAVRTRVIRVHCPVNRLPAGASADELPAPFNELPPDVRGRLAELAAMVED